jgi:hypothetical protein
VCYTVNPKKELGAALGGRGWVLFGEHAATRGGVSQTLDPALFGGRFEGRNWRCSNAVRAFFFFATTFICLLGQVSDFCCMSL